MEKSDKKKQKEARCKQAEVMEDTQAHLTALHFQHNPTPHQHCILTAMSPKCVAEEDQLPELWAHPAVRPQQPHSLGDTEAKQSTTAVDSLQNSLPSPQDSAQNVNESQTKQTPTPQWERELPTVPQLPWLLFQTQHHMQGKMKRSEIAPDVLIQPWGAPGWVCSALRNNTSVEHGRNGLV